MEERGGYLTLRNIGVNQAPQREGIPQLGKGATDEKHLQSAVCTRWNFLDSLQG